MYNPEDETLGGYTRYDGTVEFYGRIRAILQPGFTVVDLGAGRGAWFVDGGNNYKKALRDIKGDVEKVIGVDLDPAVLDNPACDVNLLLDNGRIPLDDASVDMIIADCVLEHIVDVQPFYSEIERVLKPGGYFCARTPHQMNYVPLIARVIRNSLHGPLLRSVQPDRKTVDVFPTAYKLNSLAAIRRYWRPEKWKDFSYLYTGEPRYYFGRRPLYTLFSIAHLFLPMWLTGGILVFMQKRGAT